MSRARRDRAARAVRAAQQVEDGVKVAAFRSRRQAELAAEAIEAEAARSRELLGHPDVSPALRSMLVAAGLRHLEVLGAQQAELARVAEADHTRWLAARRRVRSLEKLVERLDAAEAARRKLADAAEWQDLVTSRASRSAPGGWI